MKNGFSLVELLVATTVTLTVMAGLLGLINSARAVFTAESEVADLQQRLRVSAGTLFRDLVMAGAGVDGGSEAGTLNRYFAPVLPFRRGAVNDAGPGQYRSDTLTLYYVPRTPAQTVLAADLTPGSSVLQLEMGASCPSQLSPCGFTAGMDALVFDTHGSFERFAVTVADDNLARLTVSRRPGVTRTYPAGSRVVQVIDRTYFLKSDTGGSTQLMSYDGSINADLPVIDHVIGLTFEYFGDPQPPMWPRPPALGAQPTAYPAGENCVFQVDFNSGRQVPRLAPLGDGTHPLVKLTAANLTDGPWCPDATDPNRWDADLLRVRKVAVTIRVEAAIDALRGPAGTLFLHAGISRGGFGVVPDQEIRFQVSPRNLNLSR